MDNFEKHIRDNVDVFNEHKADRDKLWVNISAALEKEERRVIPLWVVSMMKVACFAILLLGIGGFIGFSIYKNNSLEDALVSKELQEINMHYKGLLAYQIERVHKNPNLSEADKIEFLSFIDELDAEYQILRLEMNNNFNNELILEAIVANYQKRIKIINNLLNKMNYSKNKNYEYIL